MTSAVEKKGKMGPSFLLSEEGAEPLWVEA